MFIKKANKTTLAENFEEEKNIEFQMKECKDNHISLENKETQQPSRRGCLLMQPPGKQTKQNNEKDNENMESLKKNG